MLKTLLQPIKDLLFNIRAGTKAAFFQNTYAWEFRINFTQVILLFIVSILFACLYDYIDALPEPVFNPYGLNYQAALFVCFLFSVSLLIFFEHQPQSLLKILVQFLSLVPAMSLTYILLAKLSDRLFAEYQNIILWGLLSLYLFWYAIVSYRLILKLYHLSRLKTGSYTLLYLSINFAAVFLLPGENMWYPKLASQEVVREKHINVEDTYYKQPYILDAHIDQLKPHREEKTDLYFLGFAGYADEAVFVHETEAARRLLDKRFNTKHRSMILANHVKRVNVYPLANTHNLWEALEAYADKMNVDEDILFLFLTSHGSKDHALSTEFEDMSMNPLEVSSVKQGLDGVGIKWRIIVVSACYSGGYIDELKDENSLIITASSSDRNSFGCGHDGQFTYFGEAFFGDHLENQWSFIEAFEKARADIKKRELAEDYKPSLPQIHVGKNIEKKLDNYIAELNIDDSMNWAQSKN